MAVPAETLAAVVGHCHGREAAMLKRIEALVRQNSYSRAPDGGTIVADMLAGALGDIAGMQVELVASERYAPHVVASTPAAAGSAEGAIALIGHHDTVFPPGSFEGFELRGDIAHGPGVLDMKSGLVLMIESLATLAAHDLLAAVPVRVVIVSDEEIGSPEGAQVLRTQLDGASCALVFEAGRAEDAIITQRKGTGGVTARAHGKAAHAGNHHADGVNAIWALARFVDRVQRLTDYERGVTVNVGMIEGGEARNTVPHSASCIIDLRFLSITDGEAMVGELEAAAAAVADEVPGSRVELSGGVSRPPLERSDANVALFAEYAACAAAAGLGHGEAALIGGGSDASTTAAMGIPSIDGMGPRGRGFHTKDEIIEVSSLVPKLEALTRFLVGRVR